MIVVILIRDFSNPPPMMMESNRRLRRCELDDPCGLTILAPKGVFMLERVSLFPNLNQHENELVAGGYITKAKGRMKIHKKLPYDI